MNKTRLFLACGISLMIGMASCGSGETKQTNDTVIDVVQDTEAVVETQEENNFTYNDSDTATLALLNQLTVIDGLSRPAELYENSEGLKYRIVKEGTGDKAVAGDSIVYNIQSIKVGGESMNNTFLNSPKNGILDEATFGNGLLTGVQEMNPGSIYEFFVPAALSVIDADVISVIELKEVK